MNIEWAFMCNADMFLGMSVGLWLIACVGAFVSARGDAPSSRTTGG